LRRKSLLTLLIIMVLVGPHLCHQYQLQHRLKTSLEHDRIADQEEGANLEVDQSGFMVGVGENFMLTEEMVQTLIQQRGFSDQAHFSTWKRNNRLEVAASAQGMDHYHHFVNSYLVGYQPFETTDLWVPLYTLALKKKYQYDYLQYSGLADVWQNSIQGYYYPRGDCEDHAIVLADWLIEMGLQARVVVGDYKGNGHAWVVLFHEGQTFLLEATSKRKLKNLKYYPLAALAKDYHPKYQFDRSNFWVNTGSRFTTHYAGQRWALRSRFKKSPTS
jgi:hypothetical protein